MKMQSYPNFSAYLAGQPKKNQPLIRALRAFVRRAFPRLQETVKWGNGCWLTAEDWVPVAGVYSDKDHVQFILMRGAAFKDQKKLLQGKGQYVRHIKVYTTADIDERAFANFLKQAISASRAFTKERSERKKSRA